MRDDISLSREYEIIKQEYETLKRENDTYKTLYGELTPDSLPYMVADILIDPILMQVRINKRIVKMTSCEFKILYYLTKHKNDVVSKKQINILLGCDESSRSADSHISAIRRKLNPKDKYFYIKTLRDLGYIFEDYTDNLIEDDEDDD